VRIEKKGIEGAFDNSDYVLVHHQVLLFEEEHNPLLSDDRPYEVLRLLR